MPPITEGSTPSGSVRFKLDGNVKTVNKPVTGAALHVLAGNPASLVGSAGPVPNIRVHSLQNSSLRPECSPGADGGSAPRWGSLTVRAGARPGGWTSASRHRKDWAICFPNPISVQVRIGSAPERRSVSFANEILCGGSDRYKQDGARCPNAWEMRQAFDCAVHPRRDILSLPFRGSRGIFLL